MIEMAYFKQKLSDEQIELIKSMAKEGKLKGTEIYRKLKEENKIPQDITYQTIMHHARKVWKPKIKRRAVAEVEWIESVTDLCKSMTVWALKLSKEYDEAPEFQDVGASWQGKPIIITPKKDLRPEINRAYKNFVELLKTPTFKGTQVNILQQRLESSLTEILNERPDPGITVPHKREA
uniref:Uncharacterized protein n=1 Tax=viral metagenome TaxID=1070528 RepID=A0A6M3Y194_9ZZZZ